MVATEPGRVFLDTNVVKAASSSACGRLLTEDLNHGQVIDGVRIENPFLEPAPEEPQGEATP